jgi:hypothetical protein
MTTTSIWDRLGKATPEAAKAAAETRDRDFAIQYRYGKTRGPVHFRGKITIADEIFTRDFDGKTSEYAQVTIAPDAEIYIPNHRFNGEDGHVFYVKLPAEGKEPFADSELIYTVETARETETGKSIGKYSDFNNKVVDFSTEWHSIPKRAEFDAQGNKLYDIDVFRYRCNWVGNSTEKPAEKKAADPSDVQALALSLVGQEPGSIKKMDLMKWASKAELVDEAALNALIQTGSGTVASHFVEFASSQGLLVVGEDGKLADPAA